MKQKSFKPLILLALSAIVLTVFSCSKEQLLKPTENTQSADMAEAMQLDELVAQQPVPGIYKITKFIDTNDDQTAQFSNYTFEFQADGDFIAAKKNGRVFNGTWKLNGAQTVMTISIAGNAVLKNLDDDNWAVAKITNKRIKLTAPGPDAVVFTKQ